MKMSNDLISRSAVMRLLSEKNKDGVPDNACDRAVYFFIEGLIDNIRDDIPTAYDVDEVVERLEEKQVDCFKNMNLAKDEDGMEARHIYDEFYNQSKAYEDSIEIAKAGYVS